MTESPAPKPVSERNRWTYIGFGTVGISAALLVAAFLSTHVQDTGWLLPELSTYFILNYSFALLYFTLRFVERKKGESHNYALFLVLFSISAFSLNRELALFSNMSPWATAGLLLIHLPLLASNFRTELSRPLQAAFLFLSGLGALISLYFTLYLLPIIPICIVGFFLFGLSLHALAPVLFLFEFARYLLEPLRHPERMPKRLAAFGLAGFLMPLAGAGAFMAQWQEGLDRLEALRQAPQDAEEALPAWIGLAQRLPETPLFDKLVQVDLVYDAPTGYDHLLGKASNGLSLGQYHDPLVVLAAALLGKPEFEPEEQARLIMERADLHRQSERRLWQGDDLRTDSVITRAELFPEYRLAYIEKEITIRNRTRREWQWQQEAIYQFFLPEGAAVTSLSLWVNGREEPSVLTSRSKAENAYQTIVGAERRDPAILQWQEGNAVSLRVFPCTPDEARRVKIGMSVPLQWRGDSLLVLPNVYFEGPRLDGCRERTDVWVRGQANSLALPAHLAPMAVGHYAYQGPYQSYWEIAAHAPPLSSQGFAFQGKRYRALPLKTRLRPFPFDRIVIDANRTWRWEAFEDACYMAWEQGLQVWVWGEKGWEEVKKGGEATAYSQFKDLNFSLLPIHLLPYPERTLVVTGTGHRSPRLTDAHTPGFDAWLRRRADGEVPPVAVLNIGGVLSPYWRALLDFGAINYQAGGRKQLRQYCQTRLFPEMPDQEATAVLHTANMLIEAVPSADSTAQGGGPDHLFRLYAYRQVAQHAGPHYFLGTDSLAVGWVDLASKAHVATPVSGLLVLETQEDYERFGLGPDDDGLGNAGLSNKGAIPEPGEWALFFFGIGLMALVLWIGKRRPSAS
jgi:XrtN system VIT domain protein